ncbi:MAG TPA: hypothetical protein DCQ37_22935 [Desulfobacteraceae bacterium]|jgi:signal transduction histidine kinase|nr:hypothetical protein [Desulfobacteraceae bacterium]
MKKSSVVSIMVLVCAVLLATGVWAADKNAVKKQVDDIVVAIDAGKKAADFADAAKKDPYVFIMEAGGKLLVHPTLLGQNLKEKADVVFKEVSKGTAEGIWVKYEWQGKKKITYTRKTKSGLIVGSGFNE